MSRFPSGFPDEKDLNDIHHRIVGGRLIKGSAQQLLLLYNVMAGGMTRQIFYDSLNFFGQGVDLVARQIAQLLA